MRTRPAHGMWSATKSRITAASIIRRSASGSQRRPKSDSTRQRRARKPSIWSVTPAMPKTIPAGQLCPPSALSIRATKTGMRMSRAIVSDFWDWRDLMLAEAERQTPALVRREYVEVYSELRRAGYTAVGEFHYLGFDEALAAVDAAEEAGIQIVLLLAAYGRGGLERFRQPSVGDYLAQVEELRSRAIRVAVAPHSVRACTADWLEEI